MRPFIHMLFFLAVIMLLFSSCSQDEVIRNKAVIKGNYLPFDEYIYLNKVSANNIKTLDSANLSNGEPFIFEVNAEDYTVYRLAHKDLYPIMVVVKNGDTVDITQIGNKAWPYLIKGPEECLLLTNYLEKLNRDHFKVDSLSVVFRNSQSDPDFVNIREYLNSEFIALHEGHKAFAREYVSAHPASISSIIIINGFFKEFALFNQRDDFGYYELVDEALMSKMPDNNHVKDFHSQVENIRASNEYELEARMRLSPGRIVPDFEIRSQNGEMVGPKSLEGMPLLIYFWAGADAKSRQINPVIREAYNAFHKRGMEFLAISFDKDPSVWEAAIKLDSLPGIHASDLKGAGSPVQKLFNLKMQIPAYFLIDYKGRIFRQGKDFLHFQKDIIDLYNQDPDA